MSGAAAPGREEFTVRITVKRTACLLALALLLCAPARPQSRRRGGHKPTARPSAAGDFIASSLDGPNDGEINGRVYANKFFGLRLTFPEGWFVLSEAGKQAVMESGKTRMKPLSPQEQKMFEQSIDRTYNLLTVGQYFVAPPGKSSATLMCMAEVLPVLNLTSRQYMTFMKENVLPRSTIKYEVVGDIAEEKIAGEEFTLLKLKLDTPVGAMSQEYHVTIRRGFALGFILTYGTEEQYNFLSEVLKSVALDRRAAK